MTKKMQEIIRKYENKLSLECMMYEDGIQDYESTVKWMREKRNEFEQFKSSLYMYGMISDKDHSETTFTAYEIHNKYINKLWEIQERKEATLTSI